MPAWAQSSWPSEEQEASLFHALPFKDQHKTLLKDRYNKLLKQTHIKKFNLQLEANSI